MRKESKSNLKVIGDVFHGVDRENRVVREEFGTQVRGGVDNGGLSFRDSLPSGTEESSIKGIYLNVKGKLQLLLDRC
jgi:hypothetical protein